MAWRRLDPGDESRNEIGLERQRYGGGIGKGGPVSAGEEQGAREQAGEAASTHGAGSRTT
jgi:hypothetical protein